MLTVDFREKDLIKEFQKQKIQFQIKSLLIGDVIGKNICIERKKNYDFVTSITDGRIKEQTLNMLQNFDRAFIIIEGNLSDIKTNFNTNAMLGMIASLVSRTSVSIVHTKNTEETAYLINKIVEKSEDNKTFEYEIFKIQKNKDKRICVLMLIDGINEQKAKKIITEFPSLKFLINATEKELIKAEGIGQKTARNIVDFFCLFK